MSDLALPLLHANGTPKAMLLRQRQDVYAALDVAVEAMRRMGLMRFHQFCVEEKA